MTGYRDLIERAASAAKIDPDLLEALVRKESSGNPFAWNPEPHYKYLWNVRAHMPFRAVTQAERLSEFPPDDFPCLAGDPDQEWWAQQASWGLCQVMGALARERGFRGAYLTQLVDPAINVELGCQHLASLLVWSRGDVALALGAYNAGRGGAAGEIGRRYAEAVLRILEQVRA